MVVVGIFAVHLTSPGCQQVFQGPKTVLNPVAPLPCSYEPWPADARVETQQVKLIYTGLVDHDDGHYAIRCTGGPQPRIAHTGNLRAVTPGPIAWLLQIVALHLPPIGQPEDIATLPFHEERALLHRGNMAH